MSFSREQDFDLVLVIGYFRSALPMLSIIQHLSSRLRIGVCFQPLSMKINTKTGGAQLIFESLCEKAGGIRYFAGTPGKCRLLLVQQYPYEDSFISSLQAKIKANQIWGVLSLASMGIDAYDRFLQQFNLSRLTVPDKGLANFLLSKRNANMRYQKFEMIEVGLPFKQYPIFQDFSADWIVAAPTLFSFHSELGKQKFLRDVLKLLEQIPQDDVIVYKSHNGNHKDYFTPRLYAQIANVIAWIPGVESFMDKLTQLLPSNIGIHISRVLTALLHKRLMSRACPMIKLTDKADMSIEAFLPRVRKGVIGGESNTMWGTLFFCLPYYNCVSPGERSEGKSKLLNKTGDALLAMNLMYFGIPYCHGSLNVNKKKLSISFEKMRDKNLVDLVLQEFRT